MQTLMWVFFAKSISMHVGDKYLLTSQKYIGHCGIKFELQLENKEKKNSICLHF